jgi:hypothetical protein
MPHLGSFRKGWQSENLARFILYKFSFVAHPTTVADDVGSDFFCTLFEVQREGRSDYLLPRNSFALQVKSNTDNVDVTDKLGYLESLEIPFFVGVVDRDRLKLTFYSGEYIPAFFSYKGRPEALELELCERAAIQGPADYFTENGVDSYILRLPKVAELEAGTGNDELREQAQAIRRTCSLVHDNIARKRSGRYIFTGRRDDGYMLMGFAGRTSIQLYRESLVESLAQAFLNLAWLYQRSPASFPEQEFRAYDSFLRLLEELESHSGPMLEYARLQYRTLKEMVDGS